MATRIHRYTALFLITIMGSLFLNCCRAGALPQSMIGVWETPHERYRDCALRISSDQLVFTHAADGPYTFRIKKIAVQNDDENQVVTFTYTNADDGSFQSQWVFSPRNGGELWHKSQPEIVWHLAG